MGKIHYELLNDMEKYNKDFDRKEYEDRDESEVIPEFREYYSKRLPIDLLTWCRVNAPDEKMIYKQGYWEQITFIRDIINYLFYNSYDEIKENPVLVINTHRSKSIDLPVYKMALKKYGITMIIRNNFYDWKVSVISEKDIGVDFLGLFKEDENINYLYCEGFKRNQVFGNFKEDKKQFTVEIRDKNRLFTFMYLLNDFLRKKCQYSVVQ